MSNDETPITSRRQRRRAQAERAESGQEQQLTPAQAEAEARAKAEAEEQAARARAEGLAAAHAAAATTGAREPEAATAPLPAALRAQAQPARPAPAQDPTGRARRALDVPADSDGHAERTSQARARDRATHQALRQLHEKEQAAQSAAQTAALPSRRALRQQVDTGRIPTIGEQAGPVPEAPGPSQQPTAPMAGPIPVVPPAPGAAAAPGPVPGVDPAPPTAMQGIVPNGLTVTPALGPETGSFRKLSHEQIAAAREMLKEQAKNQAAMIEAQRSGGTDVDPELLAQQVAMAERAAVLNRRARAKQRLAEETRRESAAPRKAPTPSATDNLAMVTPLEFVRVPGVPHPVMKPPSTTHVPLAAGATGQVAKQPVRTQAPDAVPPVEAAPVSARSAHGLDPLGSAQAGAGRAERERLILLGIGALGVLALIVAVIMTVLGGGS
ncbi:hypothetical protein [Sinomonas mesophila]|uniref:hypothetical protein n=1 Tax=Sinomonas mesophila TaxID=1531955 RepID=UPI0009876CF0|nr:hypothetical protein [Sinomonas mesophila]